VDQALELALDDITARLGSDMDAWRWGDLHRATFKNAVLSHVPGIAALADLSIASDGGENTVDDGKTTAGPVGGLYEHNHGPGYRAVYDLADLDNSRFIIATGQSGNVLSPHYSDFLERWRDVRYIRIAGPRDEVAADAIGTLTLRPTGE